MADQSKRSKIGSPYLHRLSLEDSSFRNRKAFFINSKGVTQTRVLNEGVHIICNFGPKRHCISVAVTINH